MKMMKLIAVGAISTFSVGTVQALDCEVSYQAKKVGKDRFLFREVSNPKYKAGKVKGSGSTLNSCKKKALRPIENKGWTIIGSKAKPI